MDESRAREILEKLNNNGSVYYSMQASWDGRCCMDGHFNADELEAIAWWMRNKGEK